MSNINILAGPDGKGTGNWDKKTLKLSKIGSYFPAMIASIELASEEKVKKIGGTLGWGAVGGTLLGPLGLLAGLFAGGRSKESVFLLTMKNGKTFLLSAESKIYKEIMEQFIQNKITDQRSKMLS